MQNRKLPFEGMSVIILRMFEGDVGNFVSVPRARKGSSLWSSGRASPTVSVFGDLIEMPAERGLELSPRWRVVAFLKSDHWIIRTVCEVEKERS